MSKIVVDQPAHLLCIELAFGDRPESEYLHRLGVERVDVRSALRLELVSFSLSGGFSRPGRLIGLRTLFPSATKRLKDVPSAARDLRYRTASGDQSTQGYKEGAAPCAVVKFHDVYLSVNEGTS